MSAWEDNWACAACYHFHTRNEERCEKCGYPMGMDGIFISSSTYAATFEEAGAQIGDWLCVNESCGLTHNSGNLMKCHKCGKGKYGTSSAGRGRISSSASSAAGGRVTSSPSSAANSSSASSVVGEKTDNPYPYFPPGSPKPIPWWKKWICVVCGKENAGPGKCGQCGSTGPNI